MLPLPGLSLGLGSGPSGVGPVSGGYINAPFDAGIDWPSVLLIGGLALGAFLILRRVL